MRTPRPILAPVACALVVWGCGAGNENVSRENRTFYANEFLAGVDIRTFEERYEPLDKPAKDGKPAYLGFTVLGGHARISRPMSWSIRAAGARPGSRYIVYLSPQQYLFALYERDDVAPDLWRDVLDRYEKDLEATGAKIVGPAVPTATWNAQGRAYVVKRPVLGARVPFENTSREWLLRNGSRVILAQLVYQGDVLPELSDELMRVYETLQVR